MVAFTNTATAPTAYPGPAGDIIAEVRFTPGAGLGQVEVEVGLGKGSKGKGTRVGDDIALHAAILRRLAAHLAQYSRDFEAAAEADGQRLLLERIACADAILSCQGLARPH